MSKAVILVSSDTSYLEHQLSLLNYTSYPIDEYNHKNIHKLYDLRFINDFIKDILLKHSHPYLIYGSGLEDKQKIYDLLTNNFIVKGNNLNMLSSFSDLRVFKSTFEKHSFKIPDDFNNDTLNGNKYIWKPLLGSGGYGISLDIKDGEGYYKQRYLSGDTYSISFLCRENDFLFLGFNKLLLLKSYLKHPFIHAGAVMAMLPINHHDTVSSFKGLSIDLSLNGYNSIDFKIINNDVYILDINPRITSTFKIYNDIYNNKLLEFQMNEQDYPLNKLATDDTGIYGYIHFFSKEDFKYKKYVSDNDLINLPKEDEYIKKGEPIFSIYSHALTYTDLISKLQEKISNLRNYYKFYDIVI
jgi:predicted ATP-grasp superfamily ATP-dependent carboligase